MKIIKGILAAVVVLGCGISPAQGAQEQDPTHPFELYGTGSLPCAAWSEARRKNDEPQQYLFRQWVAGWFVSYNYYSSRSGLKSVPSPDFDAISGWLDTYCRNNPMDGVVFAAIVLVQERGGAAALHNWNR